MLPRRARLAVLCLPLIAACVDRPVTGDSSTTGATTTGAPVTTGAGDPTTTTTPTTSTTSTTTASSCEDYTFQPQIPLVTVSVMLVLDQSPAMLDPWDHDGDPRTPEQPRWASVRNALLTVLPTVLPPGNLAALGLAPFPTPDAQDSDDALACAVDPDLFVPTSGAPPLEVLAGLPPAAPAPGTFVGGAPMRAALSAAVALPDRAASQQRMILMLANSAGNCDPEAIDPATLLETHDPGATAAAASALEAGVPVHVLGIGAATVASPMVVDHRPDNVIVSDALAALASAGGGSYFNVADEAQLIQTLTGMFETDGTACAVDISPAPGPNQAVTGVRVDGQDFPKVDDCAAEDGWQIADFRIELCGAACTRYRDTLAIEIFVTCV